MSECAHWIPAFAGMTRKGAGALEDLIGLATYTKLMRLQV